VTGERRNRDSSAPAASGEATIPVSLIVNLFRATRHRSAFV
jgi:hypothetical protein